MLSLLATLPLVAAALQDGPVVRFHDGVAVQAGDAVVTLSRLERAEAKRLQDIAVTTEQERAHLRGELLRELSWLALETQAGRELGLDPEAIRQQARFAEDQERARLGGAAYADRLVREGTTAQETLREREDELLRILWRRSRLGYPVADRRPTVDRFVRPGELLHSFRRNRDLLAPPRVRFRILAVPSEAAGGSELARKSCEEARRKVLEGARLEDLCVEMGAAFRETRGLTPRVAVPELRDPFLAALAREEEGTLSVVAPLPGPQGPDPSLGWQLVQLEDKDVPPPPRYSDPSVQERLRIAFSNQRDGTILQRERTRLLEQAYTWIHPVLRGSQGDSGAPRR